MARQTKADLQEKIDSLQSKLADCEMKNGNLVAQLRLANEATNALRDTQETAFTNKSKALRKLDEAESKISALEATISEKDRHLQFEQQTNRIMTRKESALQGEIQGLERALRIVLETK